MGISGLVLNWFCSYLSGRSFCIEIGNCQSSLEPLQYGVPHRSVLGPLLFSIYMLPLGHIIKKHTISYHFCADDTKLYLSCNSNNTNQLSNLHGCIADINNWKASNFLQINSGKTEIIIMGLDSLPNHFSSYLGPLSSNITNSCRILGIIFDNHPNFD